MAARPSWRPPALARPAPATRPRRLLDVPRRTPPHQPRRQPSSPAHPTGTAPARHGPGDHRRCRRDPHHPRDHQGPRRRPHRRHRPIITLDWPTLERTTHTIVRRPQCPSCGDPTPPPPSPPRLDTSTTTDTWRRFRHHVSPITGLVPRLIAVPTPTVAALHLYVVANGSPVAGVDAPPPIPPRAWAWGAGTDAARLGCAPSARRWRSARAPARATSRCARRVARARRARRPPRRPRAVQRPPVRPPPRHELPGSSAGAGARAVRRVNAGRVDRGVVAHRRGLALRADCALLLPTAGHDAPSGPLANSNGHAAGPTLADAVLAGLLELIERDSVAIWWGNRCGGRPSTSTGWPTRRSTPCAAPTPSSPRRVGARRDDRPRRAGGRRRVRRATTTPRICSSGSAPTSTPPSRRDGR